MFLVEHLGLLPPKPSEAEPDAERRRVGVPGLPRHFEPAELRQALDVPVRPPGRVVRRFPARRAQIGRTNLIFHHNRPRRFTETIHVASRSLAGPVPAAEQSEELHQLGQLRESRHQRQHPYSPLAEYCAKTVGGNASPDSVRSSSSVQHEATALTGFGRLPPSVVHLAGVHRERRAEQEQRSVVRGAQVVPGGALFEQEPERRKQRRRRQGHLGHRVESLAENRNGNHGPRERAGDL